MHSFTFHESTPHGTPDFPFEYFYIDSTHPRYNMPFHWHKEWEIIHILEGTFHVSADQTAYTMEKGDILLMHDGTLHGGTPENCVYECFLFDLHELFRSLESVKKHLRPIYRHKLVPVDFFPAGQNTEIHSTISTLSNTYQKHLNAPDDETPLELIVYNCITRLFGTILQNKLYISNEVTMSDSSNKIDLIKSVLEYIELHYGNSLTLQNLADTAGMNPRYFCRFFRSITHQTPMDYVNMYRIEKAAQMLLSTRLPVTDICMQCGFNDSSNFIKVFKKYKGTTPNQFRKRTIY